MEKETEMKRIMKNLLAHWQYVGGIFLLLAVELYCITGISDTVYGMKNTGSQSSGIEYMVADALSADAWQRVELYMSDSESTEWNNCYEKREDGLYYLGDMFKSQNTLSELERLFQIPQAVVYKLSDMDQEILAALLEENGGLEKTDYLEVRDVVEEQLEQEGGEEIRRCSMAFVREQSEKAGVDLVKKKSRYLSGAVFMIVLYLLILTVSCVGLAYLSEYTQRLMGRWIQETELRSAGHMMLYVSGMLFDALLLYLIALYQLAQYEADVRWYAPGLILLPVCLIVVWLIHIRPEFEKIRDELAFSASRRNCIKNMYWIVVAGIPVVVLLTGCTAVWSPCFSRALFLVAADAAVAAGAFLLPDIAAAADCVDETFDDPDSDII